jgi:hypothetical protein
MRTTEGDEVSSANRESEPRDGKKGEGRLQAPWFVHVNVWIFMTAFGLSPALYVLLVRESIRVGDALAALFGILLIQNLLWIAQRRCSRDDLTYWEGLLVVSAATTTGIMPVTLVLSSCVLLFTVAASFVFALTHDRTHPLRDASIRFARLVIAIYRRRLYR